MTTTIDDVIRVGLILGALFGALVLTIGLAVRASFIRAAGGENYYRGWKDAVKKMSQAIERYREPEDREP